MEASILIGSYLDELLKVCQKTNSLLAADVRFVRVKLKSTDSARQGKGCIWLLFSLDTSSSHCCAAASASGDLRNDDGRRNNFPAQHTLVKHRSLPHDRPNRLLQVDNFLFSAEKCGCHLLRGNVVKLATVLHELVRIKEMALYPVMEHLKATAGFVRECTQRPFINQFDCLRFVTLIRHNRTTVSHHHRTVSIL